MIYAILLIGFVIFIWAFDVIYFSQRHTKADKQSIKNMKRLKNSYDVR